MSAPVKHGGMSAGVQKPQSKSFGGTLVTGGKTKVTIQGKQRIGF